MAYDAFPNEVSDAFLNDGGQGFCLDPFSEVINSYNKELELSYCYGEGSHYVKPLLSEWPWSIHWGELLRQLLYDVAKALAFVISIYIRLGILLHSGPIVAYLYEFVNQRLCPRVVSTYSLVDFPHNIVCFVKD